MGSGGGEAPPTLLPSDITATANNHHHRNTTPPPSRPNSPTPSLRAIADNHCVEDGFHVLQSRERQLHTHSVSPPPSPAGHAPTATVPTDFASDNSLQHNLDHSTSRPRPLSILRNPPPKLPLPIIHPARTRSQRTSRPVISKSRSGNLKAYTSFETAPSIAVPDSQRPRALHSSNGLDSTQGPPSALLSRTNSLREPRPGPTNAQRTFGQRGLRPLRLLNSGTHSVCPVAIPERISTTAAESPRATLISSSPTELLQAANEVIKNARHLMAMEANENNEEPHLLPVNELYTRHISNNATAMTQPGEDVFLSIAREPSQRQSLQDRADRRKFAVHQPANRFTAPIPVSLTQTEMLDREQQHAPSAFQQRAHARMSSRNTPVGLTLQRESSPVSSVGALGRMNPASSYQQQQRMPISAVPISPESMRYGSRRPSAGDYQALRQGRLQSVDRGHEGFSPTRPLREPGRGRSGSVANADSADSVISGPAPSTVWDEIEGIKSHIRRIELNGLSVSHAGAAGQSFASGSNERPMTAATTVTTVSSSPKHNRFAKQNGTVLDATTPEEEQDMNASHPLLHQALARSKDTLSADLYRVVEAVATEALELASLTCNGAAQGAPFAPNAPTSHDRQLRRKADNMCRTVTELCIALSANSLQTGTDRSSPTVVPSFAERSRTSDARAHTEEPQVSHAAYVRGVRGSSVDPEGASQILRDSQQSRALSRIEARRTSAALSPRDVQTSIEPDLRAEAPSRQQQQPYSALSRFQRVSGSLHRVRRRADEEDGDEEVAMRPLSRAMTDIAAQPLTQLGHSTSRRRVPSQLNQTREYVSTEPLPKSSPSYLTQHHPPTPTAGEPRRVAGSSSIPQPTQMLYRSATDKRRYSERPSVPPGAFLQSAATSGMAQASSATAEERRRRITSLSAGYPAGRRGSAGLVVGSGLRRQSVVVDANGEGVGEQ